MRITISKQTQKEWIQLLQKEGEQRISGEITHHRLMDNFHRLFQSLTEENIELQAHLNKQSFEDAFNSLDESWRFALSSYIFLGQASNGSFGQFLFNMAGFAPVIAAFIDDYGTVHLSDYFNEAYDRLYTIDFIESLESIQKQIADLDLNIPENQIQAQKIANKEIGLIDSQRFDDWFQKSAGEGEFIAAMIRLISENQAIFFTDSTSKMK